MNLHAIPPKKQTKADKHELEQPEDRKRVPRRIDGALKDVETMANRLGYTEKKLRGDVARGLVPHRRLGSRIVFLEDEMLEFCRRLPGVTVSEALANRAVRRAGGTNSGLTESA